MCSLITCQLVLHAAAGFKQAFSIWWLLLPSHHYWLIFRVPVYRCLKLIFRAFGVEEWDAGCACRTNKAGKSQT